MPNTENEELIKYSKMEGSIHVCYKERLMHPYWKQHTEKIYNSVDIIHSIAIQERYIIKKYRIHILHTKI